MRKSKTREMRLLAAMNAVLIDECIFLGSANRTTKLMEEVERLKI